MSDGGRRRKGDLTPMSGELNAPADWTPPGPVAEQYRPKEEKGPPATRAQILLAGLKRVVLVLGMLSALLVGVALLLVHSAGMDVSRAFPLTFFLGGALLAAGAITSGTGTYSHWYWERSEREEAFNYSFVYAAFGIVLIAVGAGLDAYF